MTGLLFLLLIVFSALHRSAASDQYKFYLYTRQNPTSSQKLVIDDVSSIISSNFNVKNPTVVLIHGWLDDSTSDFNVAIRDAYLKKSDANIIKLDWGASANGDYLIAVSRVPSVGRYLARFLSFLNQATSVSFGNIHLVGFSLGAHVSGNAGRELGGRIARITGLDPAGPGWYGNSNTIRSSDAVYVEAIHTDANILGLGITSAVGDVDFFPNGGTNQPGCSDLFCNHNRAWEFYSATLTSDNLVANRCSNMIEVYANLCRGSELNMGNGDLKKSGSGLYRVNTKATYPY